MPRTRTFEAQIRDTQSHTSDVMDGDADVEVVEDSLHPNEIHECDSVRYYIEDDHDAGYDLTVRSTAPNDDFTGEVDHATVSLASGQAVASGTLSGPLGKIRLHYATGALAGAPTEGSARVTFVFAEPANIE